jgi:hypothetical protein
MTATHLEPLAQPRASETQGSDARAAQRDPAEDLIVIDGVLPISACHALIEEADVDRWMTTTAEFIRAANGPHTLPPRRVREPSRPCRLLGADEPPRFAVVDDPVLALRLFYRLAEALPHTRDAAQLAGLKPLLRCLRFEAGEGTEAHCDPERETCDGQRSHLSVVVFLDDEFTGGGIEFPSLGRTIEAKAGRALVFPHAALHRDLSVEHGRKFVLETEVFYSPRWQPYPER